MKISFAPFKLVLMVFALFAVIAIGANPALSAEEGRQRNNITVQGSSSVTVSPTIAYVNIGVTTFNKDATKAQSENAEKMDKVYKTLSSLG
ncbi:MAG: SIMPL domain-containing protein, partial [Synergistaceae bacterium]|nr:SIMPL domain-containing protein [Synergistaceae bacterium]